MNAKSNTGFIKRRFRKKQHLKQHLTPSQPFSLLTKNKCACNNLIITYLWWAQQDLNLRPTDYESAALTG